MTPIQQLMLGVGASEKTYLDDVFSTDLWVGDGAAHQVVNGIDISGQGGFVWTKARSSNAYGHLLADTIRGADYGIFPHSNEGQDGSNTNYFSSFNSNGFTTGTWVGANNSGTTFTGWSFRKTPGFCDVVTYTGNGTAGRTISHSLGCVPGCIMIKETSGTRPWAVYHQGTGSTHHLVLNDTDVASDNAGHWNDTDPTASVFTVGDAWDTNQDTKTYVAYVFAGADTVRWSDKLTYSSGTEENGFFASRAFNGQLQSTPNRLMTSGIYITVTMTIDPSITVESGESVIVYGEDAAIGNPYNYNSTVTATIAGTTYTSSSGDTHTFTHSGALTQITIRTNSTGGRTILEGIKVNGKLLKDGDFFISGDPHATSAQSVFGEGGDKDIIKCGDYIGTNGIDIEIGLGWEPQWILIKSTETASNWILFDSMRGIANGSNEKYLYANLDNQEYTEADRLELMSTGFKILGTSWTSLSTTGEKYVYIAIRRPDGYVGKTPELGTDVFAMAYGAGNTFPTFVSNIPVDFALFRQPASTDNFGLHARLSGEGRFFTNLTNAQGGSDSDSRYDSNVGWMNNASSDYLSWMWKRHAGFDVVTYEGNGVTGLTVEHQLSKIPEMMWVKNGTSANDWIVYHKSLNGGTNPQNYFVVLNSTSGEADNHTRWNDTAPTSTFFTLGDHAVVNEDDSDHIAMLFASVDGISKVGSWVGDDTSNDSKVITTGFNPRFVLIKRASNTGNWLVIDTVRGFTKYLRLNLNLTEGTQTFITATSTGFTISSSDSDVNANGDTYIYYAHA